MVVSSTVNSSMDTLAAYHQTVYKLSLVQMLLWVVRWVVVRLLWFVPSFLLKIFEGSIQISVSFSTLLFLMLLVSGITWAVFRYRYLNVYEKLHSEPYDTNVNQKIFVDSGEDEQGKSGFSSYLEEFLTAIKIFGYLEKPVFHELTRSMKTQRFSAGEMFILDNTLGFSIVVEGSVNVYAKVGQEMSNTTQLNSPNTYLLNGEKFKLINFVKVGNALSSLASILSLFTENFSLLGRGDQMFTLMRVTESKLEFDMEVYPDYEENDDIIPVALNDSPHGPIELPDLMAQAKTDCTIAIIPADSFRRLTRKWPNAASHIVQIVLTRLYRVTFQTAHYYLGLTSEIFQTEIRLNSQENNRLPKYLLDTVISKVNDDLAGSPTDTGSPPKSFGRRRNSTSSGTRLQNSSEDFKAGTPLLKRNNTVLTDTHSRQILLDARDKHHPGDLLSNVPLSRSATFDPQLLSHIYTTTFSADEETEDTVLRIAVIENIFKFLGVDQKSLSSPIMRSSSTVSLMSFSKSGFKSSLNSSPSPRGSRPSSVAGMGTLSPRKGPVDELVNIDFDQVKTEFAAGITFCFVKQGTKLVEQGSRNAGLYYVVSGNLDIIYCPKDPLNGPKEIKIYTVESGSIAGYLASIVGHQSLVSIVASTDSYLAFLPQDTIDKLCEKYITIYLSIARKLVKVINKDLLDLDFAVEWVQVSGGHSIYKQGMDATGIYLILSGRFREVKDVNQELRTLGEYGQGSSLGEVEVLTASKRPSSLVAVRESEAARIPRYLFEFLALRNPSIMIQISRLVAKKASANRDIGNVPEVVHNNARPFFANYKTITILPTKYGLPVNEFASKLVGELTNLGKSVISMNQASALNLLGRHAFDKLAKIKQSGYFTELEERHQVCVYIVDTPVSSSWSRACVSQGDCILLLGNASSDPAVGDYERLLLKLNTSARTELVLLHPERNVVAGSTNNWLKNRHWVEAHHHIQFQVDRNAEDITYSARPVPFLLTLRSRVATLKQDWGQKHNQAGGNAYYTPVDLHKSDFARLARILSGQAIGLVLGGGGARGLAHIGVIQALEKEGIPIDLIGGTSIGSFVGGLYAREYDLVPIYGRVKQFAGRVASVWRTLSDLTYPLVAYTTGHEFNRGVWKAFGDSRIEDFWIQFYCNSTNITNSVMEYHTTGYAWRFIRASMSLCGLVPPIIDHGNMLLDGGYVDNLPVLEMKRLGASIIFAVDVGSVDDRTPMKYGDTLSGVLELVNRWNPFSSKPSVPSMADIQLRLAYVGSVSALEKAKATPGVIYLRPPIENFGTLAFGKFAEIHKVGHKYATKLLKELREEGKIPKNLGHGEPVKTKEGFKMKRRNSI